MFENRRWCERQFDGPIVRQIQRAPAAVIKCAVSQTKLRRPNCSLTGSGKLAISFAPSPISFKPRFGEIGDFGIIKIRPRIRRIAKMEAPVKIHQ